MDCPDLAHKSKDARRALLEKAKKAGTTTSTAPAQTPAQSDTKTVAAQPATAGFNNGSVGADGDASTQPPPSISYAEWKAYTSFLGGGSSEAESFVGVMVEDSDDDMEELNCFPQLSSPHMQML